MRLAAGRNVAPRPNRFLAITGCGFGAAVLGIVAGLTVCCARVDSLHGTQDLSHAVRKTLRWRESRRHSSAVCSATLALAYA